jgi:hypothetical protein
MYSIRLDVHKTTIRYCVKDASGQVHQEGRIGATRRELDSWTKTSSTTTDRGHGSNDFHGLHLRSSAAARPADLFDVDENPFPPTLPRYSASLYNPVPRLRKRSPRMLRFPELP